MNRVSRVSRVSEDVAPDGRTEQGRHLGCDQRIAQNASDWPMGGATSKGDATWVRLKAKNHSELRWHHDPHDVFQQRRL